MPDMMQEKAYKKPTLIEAVAGQHAEQDPPVQSRADLGRFKEYLESLARPSVS
jgi:hypothetical protein